MPAAHYFFNPSARWYYPLRWLVILGLGLLIYAQTFQFGFVFDDNEFILKNYYIRDFNRLNEAWGFLPSTRMVAMYTFALNYFFNQLHPQGYHIFNFVVHLCATALVWATAGMLFRMGAETPKQKKAPPIDWFRRELPFLMALVFLVHPCQTQAVTYVAQRFESLATVFYLGTVYGYLNFRTSSQPKILFLILACASAILGLLTKETTATLPLIILVIEWIFWNKNPRRLWMILAVAGLFYGALFIKIVPADFNLFVQSTFSESHDGDVITMGNYLLTQMRVFLTFVRLLVFPVNQNLDYDYPLSTGLLHPPLTLVGMGLIATMIFLIIRLRRTLPLIAFGLAWMLITFSINLVPRPNVIFEHKLYLISFGFFLAATAALSILIRQKTIVVLLCLAPVLMVVTFERNQVWQDGLTLWQDVVEKSPKSRAYANLGQMYNMSKRYPQALNFLSKAIAQRPDDYRTYVNRGTAYRRLGRYDQALTDFNQAIKINPDYFATYIGRAQVYKSQQKYDAAFADLAHAVELQPYIQYAYTDRAVLWMAEGRPQDALKDLEKALTIAPYDYEALVNRAGVYFCLERYDLAMKDLIKAQTIDNTDAAVYKNKALCLLKLGREQDALSNFETALRLDPDDVKMRALYEEALRH